MGQYHYVVNVTKKQFLHPHKLGDGLKLMEFGSGGGTMTALAVLLAKDNGKGGGDFHHEDPLVGSWAGDSIIIAGDYGDAGVDVPDGAVCDEGRPANLYSHAKETFEDISLRMRELICRDEYVKESVVGERWDSRGTP
jgi:hypothetical protein